MASDADSFRHEHLQKWLETSRRHLFAGQDRPLDTRHDAEVRVVTRVGRQTLRPLTHAAQSEQDPLQQLGAPVLYTTFIQHLDDVHHGR